MGEVLTQVWLRMRDSYYIIRIGQTSESHKLPQAHKKCAIKTKQRIKNDAHIKMLLMEGKCL